MPANGRWDLIQRLKGETSEGIIAAILRKTACETECAIKFRKPKAVADVKSQQFPTGYLKDQLDSGLRTAL